MLYQFKKEEMPPSIKLEVIKLHEEVEEFRLALRKKDIDNLIEEGLDIIQVILNLLKYCDQDHVPQLKRSYGRLVMFDILDKDLGIIDRRLSDLVNEIERSLLRHYKYPYLQNETSRAIIHVVLEILEANDVSKEMLREGIERHNKKLRGRGWTLEPIRGVSYE